MNDLRDLREQVARRTDERRTAWLVKQKSLYSVWMFIAGVSGLLVTALAFIARSTVFGIVAAYLWFFAWNRYIEYRRAQRWISHPVTNDQDRSVWARTYYAEISQPPAWQRVSSWIAGLTASILVLVVSVTVIATSGFWMRLWYGIIYGFAALLIAVWFLLQRRNLKRLRDYQAITEQQWRDLT